MRILICCESRCGATEGIAERIGAVLRQEGLDAVVQPVRAARDVGGFDAFVIGSAAYFFHWMRGARSFVRRHRALLAERPVWLFSSGPLGSKTHDESGRDMREVLEPKEIAEFRSTIEPREHRVFFGAMQPEKLKFPLSMILKMPVNRGDAVFPVGDFRNWDEVEEWARGIAAQLKGRGAEAAGAVREVRG